MAGATQAAGRLELVERLEARREEIEQTLLTRVYAVSDPREVDDTEYALGLREAVCAALEYGIASLASADGNRPAVPEELLAQARKAARNGVSLDTVLRRYFAGYTLLSDCLMKEAEAGALQGTCLREALRSQGGLFDRLVAAVTAAYAAEVESRLHRADHRRIEQVKRLLDGELVDLGGLEYDLEASHLGVVATGSGASKAIRRIAASLDRRLLLVQPDAQVVWAWLGGREEVDSAGLAAELGRARLDDVAFGIGEAGSGTRGWRLTHRQAAAALPVATRLREGPVRYAEVTFLAASLRDEVLADSLRDLYLLPLAEERDGGETLRQTAGAYFAANRNVSAAAAALKVSRPTINSRLRAIESRVGQPPDQCAAQLETALLLQKILPVTG